MELNRELTKNEQQLITFLISNSSVNISTNWNEGLLARPLDDGGMGSLYLLYKDSPLNNKRKFGKQASECQFRDVDGVLVIASLYLDEDGNLFELDMWKVDSSKLIKMPSHFEEIKWEDSVKDL